MNNKEYLYSLEPHELNRWFESEHVDVCALPRTHEQAEQIETLRVKVDELQTRYEWALECIDRIVSSLEGLTSICGL